MSSGEIHKKIEAKENMNESQKIKKGFEFDDILETIGNQSRYQRLFLYLVVSPICLICATAQSSIYMLYSPPHFCAPPPGWKEMYPGWTLDEWKNTSIPKIVNFDGTRSFSKCEMYDEDRSSISCQYGWTYDREYYDETVITQYNWVCDKETYASTAFTVMSIGGVFGQIWQIAADKYGRKPILFLSIILYSTTHFAMNFFAHNYPIFLILGFLHSVGLPFSYHGCSIIMAELCGPDYRSWSYTVAWTAWVFGIAALPILAKYTRDWFLFGVITSSFPFILLAYYFFMPESPRWLISQGRTKEAAKIIKKIAHTNGTSEKINPEELDAMLENSLRIEKKEEPESVNVWTLFTKRNLAKATLLLSLAFAADDIVYEAITLNTVNLSGDQFVNFFLVGIVEFPSCFIGGYSSEKLGRRWTHALFSLICAITCTMAGFGAAKPHLSTFVLVMVLLGKLSGNICGLMVAVRMTELYPTPLRSTGSGFVSTAGLTIGSCAAYVVFLNKFGAGIPYYVFGFVATCGMVVSSFLPETLHQRLPETVVDAEEFFELKRDFWSIHPGKDANRQSTIRNRRKSHCLEKEADEMLE